MFDNTKPKCLQAKTTRASNRALRFAFVICRILSSGKQRRRMFTRLKRAAAQTSSSRARSALQQAAKLSYTRFFFVCSNIRIKVAFTHTHTHTAASISYCILFSLIIMFVFTNNCSVVFSTASLPFARARTLVYGYFY